MSKARPETQIEQLRNQLTPVMMLPDILESFIRNNYTELMAIPGFPKAHTAIKRSTEAAAIAGNTLRNLKNEGDSK